MFFYDYSRILSLTYRINIVNALTIECIKELSDLQIKAILFDAYGTLFDVHSITQVCEQYYPENGYNISQLWRQKQLEYTWLRTLMGSYEDFQVVTKDALIFTLNELKLEQDEIVLAKLLKAYSRLTPFPEVKEALQSLDSKQLSILSNGSPDMLNKVVERADLSQHFSHIISVDELRKYKPSMDVYQQGVLKTGYQKDEILFITSNPWDACGAKTFGFHVCWINRSKKAFDELGVRPDVIVEHLGQLTEKHEF